jgi:D-alanyl-D-alanine carboxypeptidase
MTRFACISRKHLFSCLLAAAGFMSWASVPSAQAQIGSARYSSIVVDAHSGEVLEEVNADQPRHPASLTKMMTLYMAFEALRDRRITLDQLVPVSAHAAGMEPSKLGLMPGTRISVEEAILGLVTKSANDAASALGEMLGGSEDRFAQMMTLRARALGMSRSTFTNASGLPDPDQWTTARDLAILSRYLINDFPNYYRYFSTPIFVWRRQVIPNHDHLLRSYPGADGLKTGYTDASGYNLVSSAVRSGVRLVGVVLGAGSNGERDNHMISLLDRGFEEMDVPAVHRPPQAVARLNLVSTVHAAEVPRATARAQRATWSIQVGSFATQGAARAAAAAARREAEAGEVRVDSISIRNKTVWRAQVVGLTSEDAQDACSGRRKGTCIVIRPATRQVARG